MMPVRVSKSQFKAKALEYFRRIEADGAAVIVTDHGEPTLEIRRYRPDTADALQRLRGSALTFERPTDPIDVDWEAGR
jgi:antitoxin (DNA-binding transcriptional repressor) of toxin-antitoxin stability system